VAPIFAVTLNVIKSKFQAYLSTGFNDIIAKPILNKANDR
jgi:CheY-like chemotaxis protein